MSKIPAINEIDANSPSQESTEVVVKATTVTPDINEIQETISASATIQEIDGTRKPTISEIYKIVNDGLFESTTNWWDYAYKLSQAQLNQDIISRLDNGVIGGGYSKGVDIITTTSNKVPSNTNVYSALKSDSLYPKKLNDEVINGIYDFLNGITIGKPTAYTGGTWSVDKVGKTHLTTDYLYVRLKAIFETLQILNVDTIGGKLVISPAGSIRIAYVDRIKIDAPVFEHDEKTDVWSISQVEDAEGNLVNETLNQEVYRCYFLGEQDGEAVENKWKIGDQAQAKTFNVKKGAYHKVENSYFWRLVVNVSTDTVDIDGKKYHYVDLSQIDFDSGSDAPAPGDVLNQLGHRLNDTQRQSALVLNAIDNFAPSITLYAGVNYYTFLNKEYVEFGVYNGKAFFNVYGDMYIGDKGTEPKTYIKYKNGKINIKANLEIGSSIGDKDLDQYIKENGGLDETAVKNLINNSQVIKDLQNQADGAIETWFYEGVPTPNNYPFTDKENKGDVLTYNIPGIDWYNEDINNYNAIKDSDKYTEAEKEAIKIKVRERHIGDLYYDQKTGYAYRFTRYDDDIKPYRWNVISDSELTKILEAANKAQATADGKMKVFYGETKPTNYQAGDIWVNATLEGKFNNDIARAVAKNESFNADDWVLASRYSESIADIQKWTNEYETKFSNLANEVKNQKDQSIIVWYLEYEPTLNNLPASGWTKDEKSEHIGDIVYDIKNNHSYRWTGSAWVQIKDADFNEAMKAAKDADDKASSKRRIFYSDTTPTEPFDKGDLWIKQVDDKTETWVYNGTAWVKSNDKTLADFKDAINEELTGIKGQLDGKAETWYQNTNPRNEETGEWESGGTDKSHEGDIWYDTTDGTTKYWNSTSWEKMDIPKDVFDTIDGKSSIFVDSYDDAKSGRGAINKGYKERDLWILPADATVNGTAYYKGDILTATSTNTKFDERNWERKVRYIGPTELTSAIDKVNEKINNISATTLPGLSDKFNEFTKDGILDTSEKARLTDLLNQAGNEVAAIKDQVTNITKSKYLAEDNANRGELVNANTVMNTAWENYKDFVTKLIDGISAINKVNIGTANNYYNNLQEKIKAVKQYLAICQADVLSGMGTDITSYKYLKDALNQTTEVTGGLVLTSAIQLKDVDKKVTAGMNGIVKGNKSSIAAWYGGPMVDRDTFTKEQLENKVAGTDYAMSLLRHDGTGYLAGGNIHWDAKGVLTGNFNSFILQTVNLAAMFFYIRLFYLHSSIQDTTKFENIDYVTPMKPFSRLSIQSLGGIEGGNSLPTGLFIGDSKTGGSFQVGNVIIRTNSKDPNILEIVSATDGKTAHLGVQGGVSAYGTYTPSTGGGGGLSGTIIPYSTAIASDPQNEGTKIASASSIYKLHSRISDIENNGATSITVTGTGNAITSVVKNGTSITFAKGATFLTTHQSLANYYTKSSVDSLLSSKSDTSHTHKVKINGDIKTITSNEDPIVNLGNYLTSHQSLAAYVTIHDSRLTDSRYPKFANNTWYLVGDNAYIGDHNIGGQFCIMGNNGTTGLSFHKYGDASISKSITFDGTTLSIDGNANYASSAGNADKLDGIHANGLLTAISNIDKGISITVGGTTKSVSNIQVYSATKLVTARNISIAGKDFVGNVNFDGTGNVYLNGAINYCTINLDRIDPNPFKRIAHIKVSNSWNDNALLLYISQGYIGGSFGLCRVEFRTDDITNSDTPKGGVSLRWLIRQGYAVDSIQAGYYIQLKNAYVDVFIKTTGGYQGTVIRVIQDSRGSINSRFGLINSTYNTEAYTSLSAAATALYNVAYQGTVSGVDVGTINYSNISGKCYGNAGSATKLANARTIWGQSFDGTDDITGVMTINPPTINQGTDNTFMFKVYSSTGYKNGLAISSINNITRLYAKPFGGGHFNALEIHTYNNDDVNAVTISANGNVGIGATPSYKLHVAGDIYSTASIRTAVKNQAIVLSDGDGPACISALAGRVIFNTGNAIRFGETAWDWNQWAGLKYTSSNKTIYLGIADGTVFTANSSQDNGTLRLIGIKTVTPDSRARIGGSGGNLYLGNANNSGWVCVQDMTSQVDSSYWNIRQLGDATFRSLTVNDVISCNSISVSKNAVIAGNLSVNGLINNKGILPTNYEVNNKGINCYVSADELCSGITAITDSIPVTNVDIHYSNDNGTNWVNYNISNDTKFKAYANVAGIDSLSLGGNVITGNTDAEKLAQIKKNELMFLFEIPNSCYSQVYFACVDMGQGVGVTCTVEYLNSKGVIVNTYIKYMTGWNQFNYINLSDGNTALNVGNDNRRYIRFKFKHDQNTTKLRNASINKIRIFAFTKYSFPTDRFMGHTGHIYNFDYNMNTYFPNSILAKGGVTAYQSSDIRLKQDLRKLDYLGIIKAMGGTYGFAWKKDNTRSIGWIAQHVLCNPHLKDIVETDEKGYYKINYWSPKLIATAFGAIEQVGDEVSRLKARVVFLESEVLRLSGDKEDCNKKRLDNKNINSLN